MTTVVKNIAMDRKSTYREIRQIGSKSLDLAWILLFKGLQWSSRARYHEKLVRLLQEIVGNGETNTSGGTSQNDDLGRRHIAATKLM